MQVGWGTWLDLTCWCKFSMGLNGNQEDQSEMLPSSPSLSFYASFFFQTNYLKSRHNQRTIENKAMEKFGVPVEKMYFKRKHFIFMEGNNAKSLLIFVMMMLKKTYNCPTWWRIWARSSRPYCAQPGKVERMCVSPEKKCFTIIIVVIMIIMLDHHNHDHLHDNWVLDDIIHVMLNRLDVNSPRK